MKKKTDHIKYSSIISYNHYFKILHFKSNMLAYFICFLFSTFPSLSKKNVESVTLLSLPLPARDGKEKNTEQNPPPDFQRFTEELSPSGVKGQEDVDCCDTQQS